MSSPPWPRSAAFPYWHATASIRVASVPDSRIAAAMSPVSLTAPSTVNEGGNSPAIIDCPLRWTMGVSTVPPRIVSRNTCGSRPRLSASAIAWAVAATIVPTQELTASFSRVPSPGRSLTHTVRAAMASNSGITGSRRGPGAAARTRSLPSSAGWRVPSTGASTYRAPCRPASAGSRTPASCRLTVLVWAHSTPSGAAGRAAVITSATESPSHSIVTTASTPATAPAAVAATCAPSAASGADRPGDRFHAMTSRPDRSRLRAIPAPMMPVPSTATRRIGALLPAGPDAAPMGRLGDQGAGVVELADPRDQLPLHLRGDGEGEVEAPAAVGETGGEVALGHRHGAVGQQVADLHPAVTDGLHRGPAALADLLPSHQRAIHQRIVVNPILAEQVGQGVGVTPLPGRAQSTDRFARGHASSLESRSGRAGVGGGRVLSAGGLRSGRGLRRYLAQFGVTAIDRRLFRGDVKVAGQQPVGHPGYHRAHDPGDVHAVQVLSQRPGVVALQRDQVEQHHERDFGGKADPVGDEAAIRPHAVDPVGPEDVHDGVMAVTDEEEVDQVGHCPRHQQVE